ncbi:MAG: hypothetical protein HRU03_08925 [Nanoarchaeales archaeon]|nr:hypothetical protein [Nanoarchaeales archaeon]
MILFTNMMTSLKNTDSKTPKADLLTNDDLSRQKIDDEIKILMDEFTKYILDLKKYMMSNSKNIDILKSFFHSKLSSIICQFGNLINIIDTEKYDENLISFTYTWKCNFQNEVDGIELEYSKLKFKIDILMLGEFLNYIEDSKKEFYNSISKYHK